MPISEKIDKDLYDAMKSQGKEDEVSLLRMLKSSIKNREIEKKSKLTDEEVIELLGKEVKKRKESSEIYEGAGRAELAKKEQDEANLISKYLPEQLSDEELTLLVKEAIKETGATAMQDMGKVMPVIMAKAKGRVQGSAASQKVQELLGK